VLAPLLAERYAVAKDGKITSADGKRLANILELAAVWPPEG